MILVDLLMIAIFGYLGRMSHQMSLDLLYVFYTTLPFWLGWLIVGAVLGMFQRDRLFNIRDLLPRTTAAVALATLLGVSLRALWLGYWPHYTFILLSFLANYLLLLGWRVGFWLVRGRNS